ncbi:MAG: helix-turn-helix domain-containing protein [Bacteroidota bacterium]|nr:helix-turn-helix domain-containing protein [Bacteroidota bacterium]
MTFVSVKIRDEILIQTFGEHIRKLRLKKNFSIQKLADIMNVEYRQVSDIERGKINTTISTASAIAKALEILQENISSVTTILV